MKRYIGVKEINAKPMTRLEYNVFRGWDLPTNENPDDEGFLVEYIDGGSPNTPEYSGYVSWSPKNVFDRAYKATEGMNFGLAFSALKMGHKVTRKSWDGKFLIFKGVAEPGNMPLKESFPETHQYAGVSAPWFCEYEDLVSDDWEVVA